MNAKEEYEFVKKRPTLFFTGSEVARMMEEYAKDKAWEQWKYCAKSVLGEDYNENEQGHLFEKHWEESNK